MPTIHTAEQKIDMTDEERIVLSFLLNHPESFLECSDLKDENFTKPWNQLIFRTMQSLQKRGQDVILPNILNELDSPNMKSYAGRLFMDEKVSKATFLLYAKYLVEKTNRSNIVQRLKDIAAASEDPTFDVFGALAGINLSRIVVNEKKDFKESVLLGLEAKMNNKGKFISIETGLSEYDEVVGGFVKGRLYVIAGRSSMGKSAFMTSFAERIERQHKVGIVSLEMTGEEILGRIACIRCHIPYWVIDKGKATSEQFDEFASSVNSINNVFVTDKGGLTAFEVISKIRRFVYENKCEIVFIDHLGLIQLDDRQNRAHELGKVTASLKSLAKELEIPVVILCQVNRAVEGKESKRPRLSDLRDSGRIEEDADCVTFLYRPEYYADVKSSSPVEEAELIVAKNRNGQCRVVGCTFHGPLMQFSN